MDMFMLACRTNDTRDDGPSHFVFDLSQDFAVMLVKWAEGHRQAQIHAGTTVYCIEIFHSAGEWGTVAGLEIDQSKTDWVRVADHATAEADESTELETVKVTSTGVIFSAAWKNDDSGNYFETPELPWNIINLVADGKPVPAKLLPTAEIDDAEEEGEEDEDSYEDDEHDECERCGSRVAEGFCTDQTCPFSDHKQSCPAGWAGHPTHEKEKPCDCGGTA